MRVLMFGWEMLFSCSEMLNVVLVWFVLVWGMGKWRFENGGAGRFILLSGLVLCVLRLFFRLL